MKDLFVLAGAVLLQVMGNLFLSQGMHQIGELEVLNLVQLSQFISHILANPWVLVGLGCLGGYFFCFLVALSRLDFSYVQPMLATNYVLTAFLAWLVLRESVSGLRWLGIVCVAVGIAVVGIDERKRRRKRSTVGSQFGSERG